MFDWIILAQDSGAAQQLGLYALPLIGSITLAFAIYNLIHDLRKPETKRVESRLRDRDGMGDSAAEEAAKKSILRRQKAADSALAIFLGRFRFVPALQRTLDQANIQMLAPTLLTSLVGLSAVSYMVTYFLDLPLWASLVTAIVVFFVPLGVIFIIRKRRLNKFLNQLPDVFELMSQALRAGHSLANAILIISQQLPDPVGTEFARVFHEQNLGIKIEEALKDMARRVGLLDVRFFVTAVLIQRTTGGDLAEVLDNISGVIRERIKLFGTVKALTAEGRLSGWILLALPIVVFLMELVVNPDYANLLIDTPTGQYMLMAGAVAQILGLAMIQKIVNIKV